MSSDKLSSFEARQDLEKKAVEIATLTQIKKIIGAKRYAQQKEKIHNSVLPLAKKMVVSLNSKPASKNEGLFVQSFDIGLDIDRLSNVLRQRGHFYSHANTLVISPFLNFSDKVNFKDYYWWGAGSPYQSKLGLKLIRDFHTSFEKKLDQKQFSVAKPIANDMNQKIQMNQQFLNLSSKEQMKIAKKMNSKIAIRGTIKINDNPKKINSYIINYDLEVFHLETMRSLAQVKRQAISLPGSFESAVWLAYQKSKDSVSDSLALSLKKSWKSGKVGAQLFKITVRGRLKYNQYQRFKKDLVSSIGTINSIKEKSFGPEAIVLELDATSSVDDMVKRLKASKFPNYQVKVKKENQTSLEMKLQSL